MGFTILNQNNYAGVPYPNSGNLAANIKSSGCGVVSMAMILANLAGVKVPVSDLAAYSIKHGARASAGTNMRVLAKSIVEDYPELAYTTTNDEEELKKHLQNGGMAIMNADGNDGCDGIFAYSGHYLAILGIRDGKPLIADPAWTSSRYKSAYRKKYVTDLGGGLITCDWYVLNMDTKFRTPNYYLFTSKINMEEDEMTQEQFNQMMAVYQAQQAKLPPSNWSADARKFVEDNDIFNGDAAGLRYKSPCTREELAQVLYGMAAHLETAGSDKALVDAIKAISVPLEAIAQNKE